MNEKESIEGLILQKRKLKEGEELFIKNLDSLKEVFQGDAYIAVHNENWREWYPSIDKIKLQEKLRRKFPEDYDSTFIGRIKNYVARRKRKMMKKLFR